MRATVVAYTDGLIERRGEHLDVGLERLRHTAADSHGTLGALLTRLVDDLIAGESEDDTAILGLRWRD